MNHELPHSRLRFSRLSKDFVNAWMLQMEIRFIITAQVGFEVQFTLISGWYTTCKQNRVLFHSFPIIRNYMGPVFVVTLPRKWKTVKLKTGQPFKIVSIFSFERKIDD